MILLQYVEKANKRMFWHVHALKWRLWARVRKQQTLLWAIIMWDFVSRFLYLFTWCFVQLIKWPMLFIMIICSRQNCSSISLFLSFLLTRWLFFCYFVWSNNVRVYLPKYTRKFHKFRKFIAIGRVEWIKKKWKTQTQIELTK